METFNVGNHKSYRLTFNFLASLINGNNTRTTRVKIIHTQTF